MPPPPPLSRQQSKAGAASTSLARTYSAISLLQGGEQLDALSLGLLRRKNFGTFVSALDEAELTDGLTPTSDWWAIVPASAMQEGNKLWAAFQTDPTVDNQRQLLKGYKSGASESGLGKRRRRAPGDLSDYATERSDFSGKKRQALAAPRRSDKQSSPATWPLRRAPPPPPAQTGTTPSAPFLLGAR
ncbi:unnamed protein product [Tilletia controversa]|nr:hypothetical protein CF335_g7765 [Tilletia laevis]CAD6915957.1 unnamed protein product [Tilletia controversa]CAD6923052.1 unnamed protein product [Tilletia caries]CAD6955430.1 unnamed protein product [Tilletia controversa]CAD6982449.1 unnamed protein product [Tilletia controversa]